MRTVLVAAVLAGLVAPAGAEMSETSVTCKVITDRSIELIRNGQTEQAKRFLPQLKKCDQLLKGELALEAQRIVDRSNDTARRAR